MTVTMKTVENIHKFPLEERLFEGRNGHNDYTALKLPQVIQDYFGEGNNIVRVNSKELADYLPTLGPGTPFEYSLLPHQDHVPTDDRRYIALSKTDIGERDSSTFILSKETAEEVLPHIQQYFIDHREEIEQEFQYEPEFTISEESLRSCFEEGGLGNVIEGYLTERDDFSDENRFFISLGIYSYLIQGSHADTLVEEILEKHKEEIYVEEWKEPGVLFIDNATTFHGRYGSNAAPLKKNWFFRGQ